MSKNQSTNYQSTNHQTAQVAQPEGGVPLRTETVWVRIPPGVQEDVGRHFWINPKKPVKNGHALPTLNGEYGVTVALQSSKLKVLVRVRLLAQEQEVRREE